MTHYFADWVVPVAAPPIPDGWVAVDDGRVVAVGRRRASGEPAQRRELGRVALLPGLVNAHTHLELSHLRDAVPPAASFTGWVRQAMARRQAFPDADDPVILGAVRRGIAEARAAGTVLVGDISNTLVTIPLLDEAGLAARVFFEVLKFNPDDPVALVRAARERVDAAPATGQVRVALAPHAPYSVAPLLFRALRADLDRHPFEPSSVHVAESFEEVEFIEAGTGPWPGILRSLGAWDPDWVPPATTPVAYLADAGFLDARVLVVHGVRCTPADLARLVSLGSTLVTCPRSNRWVGAGEPPISAFYASGVRVAFGTDSLASVADLNVFAEMAEAHRLAPDVAPARLIESATRIGAEALGFGAEYGSIEPGKQAALITVALPEGVDDVEACLVGGVKPERVAWVTSHSAFRTPQ